MEQQGSTERSETVRGIEAALRRIGRAIDAADRTSGAGLGLTPAQGESLRFMGATRPDMSTLGQLARVLGVRHATAVGIVNPLVLRGLAERLPHPFDRRQQVLALTEAGREAVADLDAARHAIASALEGLDDEGLARVEGGVALLVEAMQRAELIVVASPCAGCVHFRPDVAPGTEQPHRCALIGRGLSDAESRMDCPEHEAISAPA